MYSETSFVDGSNRIETSELIFKKLRYKYYNKRITICDIGNVQFHDQEKRKLNSTININKGAHTLTHDKKVCKFIQKG